MLELNPYDNQGVRFLLRDLDEGSSWEESVARDEERTRMLGGWKHERQHERHEKEHEGHERHEGRERGEQK